jgi:hypothetical protein
MQLQLQLKMHYAPTRLLDTTALAIDPAQDTENFLAALVMGFQVGIGDARATPRIIEPPTKN